MPINLNIAINSKKEEFDKFYKKLLKKHLTEDKLSRAMMYGSMNGGKRIRPFLVNIFSKIAKVKKKKFFKVISCN